MSDIQELNIKQKEAVEAVTGPVLVLAGAGSGKTKALTHRLAYLIQEKGVAPYNILAVTFTNKAAAELRERSATLLQQNPNTWHTWSGFGSGPVLGTFHSICVRILREEAGVLGYKESFVIYDTADQKSAMRQVMKFEGTSPKDINPNKVLGMISRAKNELLSPTDMEAAARGPAEKLASRLYERYQTFLKNHDAMDFDDLLVQTVRLFQQHPEVLKKYQDRWQYIMVDEYQDTNTVQYTWAQLLAGERKNLFVVGDDWQGIYSWRGATIRNILEFEKDYPGAHVIRLEQNYRSTKDIVALGNAVIAGNQSQMKKELWTEIERTKKPEVWQVSDENREGVFILEKIAELESSSNDSASNAQADNDDIEIEEVSYDYEAEGGGGTGILDRILGSMSGKPQPTVPMPKLKETKSVPANMRDQDINWNKYAVLYRTNAQSRALEEVLLHHSIPYRLIGGVRFYERKEIKDILAYLRFVLNPNDTISLARIINEPARGIGERTLVKVQELAESRGESLLQTMQNIDTIGALPPQRAQAIKSFAHIFERVRAQMEDMTVVDMIDVIIQRSGYKDALLAQGDEGEERIENIQELKNVARKFETEKGEEGLQAFLQDVALVADVDTYNPAEGSALTLMTLHSAKGLEFDTVFLVGLEEGLLPHSNSVIDPAQLEEERRLCYVGITRAQNHLYFVHTRQRALHGSIVGNMPSRFLAELGEDHVDFFEEDMW